MATRSLGATVSSGTELTTSRRPYHIGYAVFRLTLGLNIFMHGFARLLTGRDAFLAAYEPRFTHSFLPMSQVHFFLAVLPYIELIIGALTILGLLTLWSLIAGGLLMIVLVFGTATTQNWNGVGNQMLYAVYYYLLIARISDNWLAVDRLISKDSRQGAV
jgi:thiosulfate dehydrogenase [quinone] large subunit